MSEKEIINDNEDKEEEEEEQDERITRLLEYMETLSTYNPQWAGPSNQNLQQDMENVSISENNKTENSVNGNSKKKEDIEIAPNTQPGCPIGINMTPGAGREMIALRDIVAGEVLIREPYLLITPKLGAPPCCLDCLKLLGDKPTEVCDDCGAPRCSPRCEGKGHSKMECKIMSRIGLKQHWAEGKDAGNLLKQVNAITTPLRTLLLVMDNDEMGSLVSTLESNVDRRDIIKDTWETERKVDTKDLLATRDIGVKMIAKQLSSALKILGVNVNESMVLRVCGIFDTNAFEVIAHKETDGRARVIFPFISMMNHSCSSNTTHHYRNNCMFIRASQNIAKGEPVTCSYTHNLWGSMQRRKHLLLTKLFLCICPRCMDRSELGTHASSVKCQKCHAGLMVPPENPKAVWNCDSCNTTTKAQTVDAVVNLAEKNCGKLSEKTDYDRDVGSLKERLDLMSSGLGHQHYLCLELKRLLMNAYMKGKEPELKLSDSELWEVLDLTTDLLDFADKVDPGYSSFRGELQLTHIRAATALIYRHDKKFPIAADGESIPKSSISEGEQLSSNGVSENIANDNANEEHTSPKVTATKRINKKLIDTKVLASMGAETLEIIKYDPVLPEATKIIYVLYKIYSKRGHFVLSR